MAGQGSRAPAPPVILPATEEEKAVVIFLHHTGASGLNWSKRFESMRLAHVRYIFPNAPVRPLTIYEGAQTTAWYDVHGYSTSSPLDENSLFEANANIHGMLEELIASGLPSDRIILGGYSLGGSLALYSTLSYNKPLAGCVCMNCWVADYRFPDCVKNFRNKTTPVLQMHGDADPFIAMKYAKLGYDYCRPFNPRYIFKVYKNTSHWPTPEMLEALKTFIADHTNFSDPNSSDMSQM